jgi:hypothetical protein
MLQDEELIITGGGYIPAAARMEAARPLTATVMSPLIFVEVIRVPYRATVENVYVYPCLCVRTRVEPHKSPFSREKCVFCTHNRL